jgi:hypothetical protein
MCCLSGVVGRSPRVKLVDIPDKSCNLSAGGRGYEFLTVLNRQTTGSREFRFSSVLFAGTSVRSSRKAFRLNWGTEACSRDRDCIQLRLQAGCCM